MKPADAFAELGARVSFADEHHGRQVVGALVGAGHLVDVLTAGLAELRDDLAQACHDLEAVRADLAKLKPDDMHTRAKPAEKPKAKGD